MRRGLAAIAVAATSMTGACATMPDVQYHYYLPMSETKVTVTQTVACDAKKTRLHIVNSVNQVTGFKSDPTRPQAFALGALDGAFSDISSTFTFTDDGRLKTVNAATTGQGEAVLKSAVSLATVGLGAIGADGGERPEPCEVIAAWGDGKPVTLIYSATVTYPEPGASQWPLTPEDGSRTLHGLLKHRLPPLTLKAGAPVELTPSITAPSSGRSTTVSLTLSRVQSIPLEVTSGTASIWTTSIVTPARGSYVVPVPKSALFGKQTFGLTVSDPGAVVSVNYAKDTGVAGSLNAAQAVGAAATPDTAAQQAAATKAEADLIAQQQRLARCQADPKTCS